MGRNMSYQFSLFSPSLLSAHSLSLSDQTPLSLHATPSPFLDAFTFLKFWNWVLSVVLYVLRKPRWHFVFFSMAFSVFTRPWLCGLSPSFSTALRFCFLRDYKPFRYVAIWAVVCAIAFCKVTWCSVCCLAWLVFILGWGLTRVRTRI